MQKRFLRNTVALSLLVGLTLIAAWYVHNTSPPPSSPASVEAASPKQKPADSPKSKVTTDPSHSSSDNIAAQPTNESAPAKPAGTSPLPSTVGTSAAKPVEPGSLPSNTSVEVSRSTFNTYSNPGYPYLSKENGPFGQFHYRDTSGGRIEIDPEWVAANIVTIVLPGLNRAVEVHKEAADNFLAAFNYIQNGTAVVNGREVSLLSLIRSMDGTFVSRHVNWNPTRGLSNHSWGIAIDINAANHFCYVNPASEPDDPNLILWEKAFKPAGFSWGNSYNDSMHFELLD